MKLEALAGKIFLVVVWTIVASVTPQQAVGQDLSVSGKAAGNTDIGLLSHVDKKAANKAGDRATHRDTPEKPNVILILTDDQGYGDLSAHGNPALETPNIDKLHEESIRFTDFHVAPMCTPTRSQLMTGQDALSTGAFIACCGFALLDEELPTMADIFKENNYETGLFGKWHLGDNYPYRAMDRGFNETVMHKGWGITSTPDYWNNDYFDDYYWHNGELKQYEGYVTNVWFSEAMSWMRKQAKEEQPFFTYLSVNAPHAPLYVPDQYRQFYLDKGLPENLSSYFGMVDNIDDNVGRLNTFLKETGLKDNTILIFMTDNGTYSMVTNFYNAGMRGTKDSLYEGGHRVPFFLRWPDGKLKSSGDISTLTQVQDLLPTLIDLAGLETTVNNFDGTSLVPLLTEEKSDALDERMLVIQYGAQPWYSVELPVKGEAAVLWKKWRLVNNKELYNVDTDPAQEDDVAGEHPEILQKMQEHYERWWNRMQPHLEEVNHISVGTEFENPVILTSHDWHFMNTANSTNIRAGVNRSGPWYINIEEEGAYEVALYRWPKESKAKLRDGLPAHEPAHEAVDHRFPEGKALPVDYANLRIGSQTYTTKVSDNDYAASFDLELKEGKARLQTWFYDENRNQLSGAYHVHITKKD